MDRDSLTARGADKRELSPVAADAYCKPIHSFLSLCSNLVATRLLPAGELHADPLEDPRFSRRFDVHVNPMARLLFWVSIFERAQKRCPLHSLSLANEKVTGSRWKRKKKKALGEL